MAELMVSQGGRKVVVTVVCGVLVGAVHQRMNLTISGERKRPYTSQKRADGGLKTFDRGRGSGE